MISAATGIAALKSALELRKRFKAAQADLKDSEMLRIIAGEFIQLNDSFERYLAHLHVPTTDLAELPNERIFIGEPTSELEQALKEHAESLGHENGQK